MHADGSRTCEYSAWSLIELKDEMVQFASGEFYCPGHRLQLASRSLVLLSRAEGDADWTANSEIIGETLPDLVT